MSELDDQLLCCIQRHPFAIWPDDGQRPSFPILFFEQVDIILLVLTKKKITDKEYIYDSSLTYIQLRYTGHLPAQFQHQKH